MLYTKAIVGITARIIFWLIAVYFVGSAAITLFVEGFVIYSILALVFFPITYFLYPFTYGQWWLFIISVIAYAVSTLFGKLDPVE